MKALVFHLLLALRLNVRSWQSLVYGYAFPVVFLITFGALFRGQRPPLLAEMGQLVTLTILGGACFGYPTGLVAERERGVWRRYQLLPVSLWHPFLASWLSRVAIVLSGVALQLCLAHALYGTPWPAAPATLFAALLVVTVSFMGLGLVVASVAEGVPAVQALGQCLFLPMVILGGVGVPLDALPSWALRLSAFMPGRYAVEWLQSVYETGSFVRGDAYAVLALLVIGVTGYLVGLLLFRRDNLSRLASGRRWLAASTLLPWVLLGATATVTDRWEPPAAGKAYENLTEEDLAGISLEGLPSDNDLVSPLAPPFAETPAPRERAVAEMLKDWLPAKTGNPTADVRQLLSLVGLADVAQDARERILARAAYDLLRARYGRHELTLVLGWIILNPDKGAVVTEAPELGIKRGASEEAVRYRVGLYARKFYGRVTGRMRD